MRSRSVPYCCQHQNLLGALGLALLLGVAACGGASAPTDVRPPMADALALTVTQHDYLVPGGDPKVIFTARIGDTETIASIQRGLAAMYFIKPNAVYNCPAGTPSTTPMTCASASAAPR
jgi:hypothetical protein